VDVSPVALETVGDRTPLPSVALPLHTVYTGVCVCVMSEHEVNPVLVFAGFIASVALVFAVITSSIALYRRTRQRHLSSSAVTVLATRRPDKQDGTVATSNRRPTPVCRDVMRLTPVDDDRKASSRNSA